MLPSEEAADRTGRLEPVHQAWLKGRAQDALDHGQDILLFSHHQYVSPFWSSPVPNENLEKLVQAWVHKVRHYLSG